MKQTRKSSVQMSFPKVKHMFIVGSKELRTVTWNETYELIMFSFIGELLFLFNMVGQAI